jgi:hypothetical protein
MGNGPEFFQTIMGRKFYEADVPRALKALERIAAALERIAAEEYPVEVEEEESTPEQKCGEEICCDEPECPARKAREAFRP